MAKEWYVQKYVQIKQAARWIDGITREKKSRGESGRMSRLFVNLEGSARDDADRHRFITLG